MTSAERARLLSEALLDSGIDWRHEPLLEEVKQLLTAVMRADRSDLQRPAPLAWIPTAPFATKDLPLVAACFPAIHCRHI